MKSRKQVSFAAVVIAASSLWGARAAPATPPARLGDDVVPRAQSLSLRLDPAAATYDGRATIEIEVMRPASSIRLHAAGETLRRVALIDAAGTSSTPGAERDGDLLVLEPASPLAPGRYRLEIDFTQTVGTRAAGLYRVKAGGDAYLYTQFEQIDARTAFPCFDEPGFKIPWSLELDVPAGDLALGNTSIASERTSAGRKVVRFTTTPPLPSYLVALAVGPFDTLPIPGLSVPGRIVTVKGAAARGKLASEVTPGLLRALEGYFARAYPFDKLDLIAVPDFAFGAMENPGAITYADSVLLSDPRGATEGERLRVIEITAHELAHMWFGDLVTMRWWNDLWLNESFADWMANKIALQTAPELGYDLGQVRSADFAMRTDATATAMAVRLPDDCTVEDAFATVGQAYTKGVGVLSMAEAWIGDEAFRKGLLSYLDQHAWGSADANDLWRALGAASGEDVVGVLSGFMQAPGVPLLTVTADAAGHVTIRQERFHRAGDALPAEQWRVPVVLSFADDAGMHTVRILLAGAEGRLDLAPHGALRWLSPNAGARGYYRWSVDSAALGRLVGARAQLSRAERVGLLGNQRALLDAGLLGGGDWVRTLANLAGDPDPLVKKAVVDGVVALQTPFATAEAKPVYAEFVRRLFGPAARGLGWEPRRATLGEEELRDGLLSVVGVQGEDHDLRVEARRAVERWLGGEAAAVDPSLLTTALRLAALDGDRVLFDRYQKRLPGAVDAQERNALLYGLGSFSAPALAAAGLDLILGESTRSSDGAKVLFAAARDEEGRGMAFEWLRKNWAGVSAKLPPYTVGGLPRIAGGCSPERLAAARDFYAGKSPAALQATVEKTADGVEACARLRQKEGAGVSQAMREASHGGLLR